ncbi:tol-pal system protein YbgF [Rhodoblastus acidophilus]|uniref:Cell division coordinator CpoB n=1 Tax=Candidatus Rhodoblastus alkanivorans TaxID=2954117 RepID=A0ABS9Z382_9HYPH|nr:tol-pal system protein YbgF [Candidatus Rhodoblastus alkanivorans]MCI4677562.1 tol-pal system protein YbgF [Candidatus Rhodoblastus alkanivorans]MCI4681921.1 tol-pal system protein YbgF [Candidatus Rhodoblastus alkanivorans]MDI4642971.1 tol-pal system protein YbgF [Rhodoblastus acidophilus]
MSILSPGALCFAAPRKKLMTALIAAALFSAAGTARAQFFDRPAANVPNQGGDAQPNRDTSSLLRIDRLESQVRNLNGQVEQLQFQVKQLEDVLRKFQTDVDARFDENARSGGHGATPQRRSELSGPSATPSVAANVPPPAAPDAPAPAAAPDYGSPTVANGRRHDAFNPSADPNAPGAPLPLGSSGSASAPLDIRPPSLRGPNPDALASVEAPSGAMPQATTPAPAPGDPIKAEYEAAAEQLRSQHYDAAQQAFSAFVEKNPHSRYIAPAIYHLGESYYYRNRHREAAEQFLKIATDYARSPVAPYAMIKLGVSLNALGAKEQACAFFSEMPRKYPNASPAEKLAAAREARKASC